MLERTDLFEYLAQTNLLDPRAVVENDLVLAEFKRRNLCYGLISADSQSYLIKQGIGKDGKAGVMREAHMYSLLSRVRTSTRRSMLPHIPAFIRSDAELGLLVLEYLTDARTLLETYDERARFPCSHAAKVAVAIGTLHQLSITSAEIESLTLMPPPALELHQPDLDALCSMSGANRQFISLLQSVPELCLWLDNLRASWRPISLINADLKWANILLHRQHARRRRSTLKIIDWEFARIGDPAWDVGSTFHDYLYCWLLSAPVTDNASPQRLVQEASIQLKQIQPALRAFWDSYKHTMQMEAGEEVEFLEYAVRYAAVRLLQSVFEHNQNVSVMLGNTSYFVQLALNLLKNPLQAALRLLGIPLFSLASGFNTSASL